MYDFPHPFGANSLIKVFAKKAVFISLSALFCNLNFTDYKKDKTALKAIKLSKPFYFSIDNLC